MGYAIERKFSQKQVLGKRTSGVVFAHSIAPFVFFGNFFCPKVIEVFLFFSVDVACIETIFVLRCNTSSLPFETGRQLDPFSKFDVKLHRIARRAQRKNDSGGRKESGHGASPLVSLWATGAASYVHPLRLKSAGSASAHLLARYRGKGAVLHGLLHGTTLAASVQAAP